MKTKVFMTIYGLAILLGVMLFGTTSVQAFPNWDIYSDAIIVEGDEYGNVYIYDTPPERTTVSMFGGWVSNLRSYDSSIFNMFGGTAEAEAYNQSTFNVGGGTIYTLNSFDSSSVNVFGGSVYGLYAYDTGIVSVFDDANVDILRARSYSIANIAGGTLDVVSASQFGTVNLLGGLVSDYLAADNSGIINVYGYDLAKFSTGGHYGFGFVSGEWANGNVFNIDLSGPGTFSRIILYDIPEPATGLFIVIGSIALRRRRTI